LSKKVVFTFSTESGISSAREYIVHCGCVQRQLGAARRRIGEECMYNELKRSQAVFETRIRFRKTSSSDPRLRWEQTAAYHDLIDEVQAGLHGTPLCWTMISHNPDLVLQLAVDT